MQTVDVGFGNYVSTARIISICSPESLPVRRIIQDAKNANRAIDVSCGKKTRSLIITDGDLFILSAEEPSVLAQRLEKENNADI